MKSDSFRLRVCHPLRRAFPDASAMKRFCHFTGHPHAALQPRTKRFGLLRVRSPLLAESLLMSFPGLLRWFTSPSMALPSYFIQTLQCMNHFIRVTPFGHPRITGYVLLPAAFRSLSRPSSPVSSKASAMDLYSLDHITFPLPSTCAEPCMRSNLIPMHPACFKEKAFTLSLKLRCFPSLIISNNTAL